MPEERDQGCHYSTATPSLHSPLGPEFGHSPLIASLTIRRSMALTVAASPKVCLSPLPGSGRSAWGYPARSALDDLQQFFGSPEATRFARRWPDRHEMRARLAGIRPQTSLQARSAMRTTFHRRRYGSHLRICWRVPHEEDNRTATCSNGDADSNLCVTHMDQVRNQSVEPQRG